MPLPKLATLISLLAVFAGLALSQPSGSSAQPLALTGVTVIDGTGRGHEGP